MKHYRIQVTGKVQGVAFRYYTRLKAEELGVLGTTENQKDGSVISFVYGEEKKVQLFIDWCHEGSPASKVEKVIVTELSEVENAEYKDFSILR